MTDESSHMSPALNVTTLPVVNIDDDQSKSRPENSRNVGLVRIWVAMQNTLCGFSTVNEDQISSLTRDIKIGLFLTSVEKCYKSYNSSQQFI